MKFLTMSFQTSTPSSSTTREGKTPTFPFNSPSQNPSSMPFSSLRRIRISVPVMKDNSSLEQASQSYMALAQDPSVNKVVVKQDEIHDLFNILFNITRQISISIKNQGFYHMIFISILILNFDKNLHFDGYPLAFDWSSAAPQCRLTSMTSLPVYCHCN